MSFLRNIASGLRALFRKERIDGELDEEVRAYLAMAAEGKMKEGMSREDAVRKSRLELGNVEVTKETVRAARWESLVETSWQDLRYGLRMLRRSPGFSAVAVLTLALGIGATSSIFSVVKAVILNPLPFREPEKLVHLWQSDRGEHYHRGDQPYFSTVSPGMYYEWRAQSQSFESISAYRRRPMLFGGDKRAELVDAQDVVDQFFETLGVPSLLGRTFQAPDYAPAAPHTAILSYGMWAERFAKDPGIIGRRISLDREPYEIVGVMPPGFFPTPGRNPQLWTPHWANEEEKQDRNTWGMFVIARLKPKLTWEQAQTELDIASARIAKNHPAEERIDAVVVPMESELIGSSWKLLLLLAGGVTLLLLIACVNVANLLLARVTDREKEFSVRSALGAARWRLTAQVFMESFVLSLAAGLVGVGVASAGTRGLITLLPTSAGLPRLDTVKMDSGVLAFAFGLALFVTLFSSLFPLLRLSRNQAADALKSEGRGSSAGRSRRRVGQVFVVSEFALSLVLLIIGALLVESFLKLLRSNPGFDTRNLLAFHITVPEVSYGKFDYRTKDTRREKLYEQLERTLGPVQGVQSVALRGSLPLAHEFNPWPVQIEGREPPAPRPGAEGALAPGGLGDTAIQSVNPQYFQTLRLRLMNGRFLDERDTADMPLVAVVNEAFARTFFPSEDPVGKRVTVWFAKPLIVGVVADFKLNSVDRNPLPEIFWSLRQLLSPNIWVMVRSKSNPSLISAAVRQKIQDFDSDLPIQNMESMSEVIADSLWVKRVSALLIGLVAILAITLAGTGIYSVMSYSVSQRTREVGIRVALGANRHEVLSLIMGETCRLALVGCVVGCAVAYFVGRVATNQVYLSPQLASSQIPTSLSAAVFLACSLFLFGVALSASYMPARHALRVDPIVTLRHE